MTVLLSILGVALLFGLSGMLRTHDRCERNCGSCGSHGCSRITENRHV